MALALRPGEHKAAPGRLAITGGAGGSGRLGGKAAGPFVPAVLARALLRIGFAMGSPVVVRARPGSLSAAGLKEAHGR